jgi:hypothetical protein
MTTTQPGLPAAHPLGTGAVPCLGTSICPRACEREPGPAQAGRPQCTLCVSSLAPNKPNRRSRPERSTAQSNGSHPRTVIIRAKQTQFAWDASCGKSLFSNAFQQNGPPGPGQKQTQSNPIGLAVLTVAGPATLSVVEWGCRTDLALALDGPRPGRKGLMARYGTLEWTISGRKSPAGRYEINTQLQEYYCSASGLGSV